MMRSILKRAALALSLALFAVSPVALAAGKTRKPSAEHVAAIKQCKADYAAATKEAKTKRGKERKEAMAAARKTERECFKNAPR